MFLDQRAFEYERLQLGVCNDILQVDDVIDQSPDLRGVICALLEVGSHTAAEIDGLTDVDDRPVFIFMQITAGLGRQGCEFGCQFLRIHTQLYHLVLRLARIPLDWLVYLRQYRMS